MYFIKSFALAALVTVAAAADSKIVDLVIEDISLVDSGFAKLAEGVRSWDGKSPLDFALKSINGAGAGIGTGLGILHSSLLPDPLSLPDALRLADHMHNTLGPHDPGYIQAFIDRSEDIKRAGLGPAFKANWKLGRLFHLAFANNVLDKAPPDTPPDKLAQAHADVDAITDAIDRLIVALG